MNLAKFSVRKPVTVLVICICILIVGAVSFTRTNIDLMPDINMPMAFVMTSYAGAGPEEVENMVTKPMEEAMASVSGVKELYSYSLANVSMVLLMFDYSENIDDAAMDMRERIDLIESALPDGTSDPIVYKMNLASLTDSTGVLTVAVTGGDNLSDLTEIVNSDILSRIERIDGVASVNVSGSYNREIRVIPDLAKLSQYGLTINDLTNFIQANNYNLPLGTYTEDGNTVTMRAMGQFASLNDIRNVNMVLSNGTVIKISDVARVIDANSDQDSISYLGPEACLSLSIQKESGSNSTSVAGRVLAELEKISGEMHGRVNIYPVYNQADMIDMVIDNMVNSLLIGAILAVIILFVFLRSVRSTLVIAISIPMSLIATFCLLYFNDMTLNIVTLGGLTLGAGMMVDSSIVVLENVYRHHDLGLCGEEAAVVGTGEIAMAVVASTLTTIAVFLPVAFGSGVGAILFKDMGLTISFALIASLLMALTLVPLLAARMLGGKKPPLPPEEQQIRSSALSRKLGAFGNRVLNIYRGILSWSLSHRAIIVTVVILLLALSVALLPSVGVEFMPSSDYGMLMAEISMPSGTSLQETDAITQEIMQKVQAAEIPEVDTVFATIGGSSMTSIFSSASSSDSAMVLISLKEKTSESRGDRAVARAVEEAIGQYPGVDITVESMDMMSSIMSSGVAFAINGDDLDELKEIAEDVKQAMEDTPGIKNVQTDFDEADIELQMVVNEDRAVRYGLTMAQVTSIARTAFNGSTVTTYRENGKEYDVVLIYAEEDRDSLEDIKSLLIATPYGGMVRLGELASFSYGEGTTQITRVNQVRQVEVSGELLEGYKLNDVSEAVADKLRKMALPVGYSIEIAGEMDEVNDAFGDLYVVMIFSILLVYAVMACLFESFFSPFIIFFTLPTTFVGVVLSLVLTGYTLNICSLIGCVMLAGIVVNNGIVLVDYINKLRERGMERDEAVKKAAPMRVRPILMTTFTTVLAMVPMALSQGNGADMSKPMAVVIIGGLLCSTIFTLIFVPVIYTLFDGLGRKFKRQSAAEAATETAAE